MTPSPASLQTEILTTTSCTGCCLLRCLPLSALEIVFQVLRLNPELSGPCLRGCRQASHCPPGPGRMVTMCHTGVRTQLNQSAINNAANTGTSTRCWPALICSFRARHRDQGGEEQRGGGSAQAVRHAPTSQGQRENGQRPDTGGQGGRKWGVQTQMITPSPSQTSNKRPSSVTSQE